MSFEIYHRELGMDAKPTALFFSIIAQGESEERKCSKIFFYSLIELVLQNLARRFFRDYEAAVGNLIIPSMMVFDFLEKGCKG